MSELWHVELFGRHMVPVHLERVGFNEWTASYPVPALWTEAASMLTPRDWQTKAWREGDTLTTRGTTVARALASAVTLLMNERGICDLPRKVWMPGERETEAKGSGT